MQRPPRMLETAMNRIMERLPEQDKQRLSNTHEAVRQLGSAQVGEYRIVPDYQKGTFEAYIRVNANHIAKIDLDIGSQNIQLPNFGNLVRDYLQSLQRQENPFDLDQQLNESGLGEDRSDQLRKMAIVMQKAMPDSVFILNRLRAEEHARETNDVVVSLSNNDPNSLVVYPRQPNYEKVGYRFQVVGEQIFASGVRVDNMSEYLKAIQEGRMDQYRAEQRQLQENQRADEAPQVEAAKSITLPPAQKARINSELNQVNLEATTRANLYSKIELVQSQLPDATFFYDRNVGFRYTKNNDAMTFVPSSSGPDKITVMIKGEAEVEYYRFRITDDKRIYLENPRTKAETPVENIGAFFAEQKRIADEQQRIAREQQKKEEAALLQKMEEGRALARKLPAEDEQVKIDPKKIIPHLLDPITGELMKNPVVITNPTHRGYGFTYDLSTLGGTVAEGDYIRNRLLENIVKEVSVDPKGEYTVGTLNYKVTAGFSQAVEELKDASKLGYTAKGKMFPDSGHIYDPKTVGKYSDKDNKIQNPFTRAIVAVKSLIDSFTTDNIVKAIATPSFLRKLQSKGIDTQIKKPPLNIHTLEKDPREWARARPTDQEMHRDPRVKLGSAANPKPPQRQRSEARPPVMQAPRQLQPVMQAPRQPQVIDRQQAHQDATKLSNFMDKMHNKLPSKWQNFFRYEIDYSHSTVSFKGYQAYRVDMDRKDDVMFTLAETMSAEMAKIIKGQSTFEDSARHLLPLIERAIKAVEPTGNNSSLFKANDGKELVTVYNELSKAVGEPQYERRSAMSRS